MQKCTGCAVRNVNRARSGPVVLTSGAYTVRDVNRDTADAARLRKCTAVRPRRRPTQPGLTFVGAQPQFAD
jgi:hypothetical protein